MAAEHGFPPPPQERIPERTCEQVVDVRIRLVVEQVLEVPKNSSQDRTLQRAVEQIPNVLVPEMVTQLLEVPRIVPQDRILQQTVEQVASNREAPVKVFSEELKALAEATQVLQSETSGADGQPYSLFTGKFKRRFADIDRSQRIRTGDIGQTTRRAGAFNYARSAGIVLLCNHEVWCRR